MIAWACPAAAVPAWEIRSLRARAFTADNVEKADQIVVYKSKRMMYLMRKGRIIGKYRVALGKNPVGHKIQAGDNRTPEGKYVIDMKNPNSSFFLSLRISYPDHSDRAAARAMSLDPGNLIMIHGIPNDRSVAAVSHPDRDWTNGCIAVTNREMVDIWKRVDVGTKITIWP